MRNVTATVSVCLWSLSISPGLAAPNDKDCSAARMQAGAWATSFNALTIGLQQDRFVSTLPPSLKDADPDLEALITKVGGQKDKLLPVMQDYSSLLKELDNEVLRVCGPSQLEHG